MADPPSTTPTTTRGNRALAVQEPDGDLEASPARLEELRDPPAGDLLAASAREGENEINRASELQMLRLRADIMFLDPSRDVVASQMGFCAVEKITNKHFIDVRDIVDQLFDEHQHTGRFIGVVDRQQARGWLLADLTGRPLLPPGTARAEGGTARGVGNEVAKEAKAQAKAAKDAAVAAKKRAKRAGLAHEKAAADATAAVLEAEGRDVGLLPMEAPSRRDAPRWQRLVRAREPVAATPAAVSREELERRLRVLDAAEKADQELQHNIIVRSLKRWHERRDVEAQLLESAQ